jgi:hypothetical protein
MNAILLEQGSDLTAVESAAPISVQNPKHIVNDVIRLNLAASVVVVAVGVALLTSVHTEPLFVFACLELQLAFFAVLADHLWGCFLLLTLGCQF